MFDSLSERLQGIFRRLRSRGRLTEKDVDAILREVRVALLEADVNYRVAKELVARIRERAVGEELSKSLDPAQQVIKIVHEELIHTLGTSAVKLKMASHPPTKLLLSGLQGSGKTTTAGKLAVYMRKKGHRPLLVACDLQRPAAIEQLRTIGRQIDIPVYSVDPPQNPVQVAIDALEYARNMGNDVMIVDTAGRLAIDEALMAEMAEIRNAINPDTVLLVVDAMTGQDAVRVAEEFTSQVGVDGVILSKLDGDARGGAAISVREVTGAPIYFAGLGEKPGDFDVFYPDRMAGRILGMGDVLSLIEKAEQEFDLQQAKEMEEKIRKASFDLEDFLDQLQRVKKMGSIAQLLGMLPGLPGIGKINPEDFDESEFSKVEAIIRSMTPEERRKPSLIKGSRRRRIALGSGTTPADVNMLLRQFGEVQKMMKQFAGMTKKGRRRKNLLPGLEELSDLPIRG